MENLKQNPQNNNNEGTKLNRRDFLAGLATLTTGLPNLAFARSRSDINTKENKATIIELEKAYDLYLADYKDALHKAADLSVSLLSAGEDVTYADFKGLYDIVLEILRLNDINRGILERLLAQPEWKFSDTYGESSDSTRLKMQDTIQTYKNNYKEILALALQAMQIAFVQGRDSLDEQDSQDVQKLISAIGSLK